MLIRHIRCSKAPSYGNTMGDRFSFQGKRRADMSSVYIKGGDQGLPFGDCLLLSALLHRPCKAAGYAVPTATAPLCGLLHCLPCVAKLKEANNHQMADPGGDYLFDPVTSATLQGVFSFTRHLLLFGDLHLHGRTVSSR